MSQTQILSPIPGVFYRRPSPEEDVFVKEGDRVSEGQVIGLVEVMKSYFEVKSDVNGVVESFGVENEGAVDAGQEIAVITKD